MDRPWKSKKFQQKGHKRYLCRCNIRVCQARITKKVHPYDDPKHSKCPERNCKGILYVDWYRMWPANRDKDRGKICYCDRLPHPHMQLK